MDLTAKTALVTGGAKRIGRAVATALAAAGADVIVHYNTSADEADDLAGTLRRTGRKAWTLQADLAEPEQADALMGRAVELAGAVDVLVNNASIFPKSRLADFSPAHLAENLNLHAVAPLLLGRRLAAQGRAGAIVNMLDCRIAAYDRTHAAYHLSKRALLSLTRMMALDFAPAVRVNAVAPGLILPPPGEDPAFLQRLVDHNPMKRHGSAEGVADAVVYLIGADFVTGQVIFVDGGYHLRGAADV